MEVFCLLCYLIIRFFYRVIFLQLLGTLLRHENHKVLGFYQFRPSTGLTSLILKINKEAKKVKRPGNIFHSFYVDWDFEDYFLTLLFSNDKGTKEHDLCLKRNILLF